MTHMTSSARWTRASPARLTTKPCRLNSTPRSAGSKWSWTGRKKNLTASVEAKRALVEISHPQLSICRQCELLSLSRSSFYYEPATESKENLALMNLIDQRYTDKPFYGSRKMTIWLRALGHEVNRKRVQRLMRLMGLQAIYPKPKLSLPDRQHKVYPYLLRDVAIVRPNQVWSTDITYIGLPGGFMYLAAIIDWSHR